MTYSQWIYGNIDTKIRFFKTVVKIIYLILFNDLGSQFFDFCPNQRKFKEITGKCLGADLLMDKEGESGLLTMTAG
jgi:hypothetical protein